MPDKICDSPRTKYVTEFTGSPAMNFISETLGGDAFRVSNSSIGIKGCSWAQEAAERIPFSVEIFEPMGSDTLQRTSICGQSFHFRLDG